MYAFAAGSLIACTGLLLMQSSSAFELTFWKIPWLWIDPIVDVMLPKHSGAHGMGDLHLVRWWLEARLSLLAISTFGAAATYWAISRRAR
jgi:hypothetical protein